MLGCIVTPRSRDRVPERALWAADNGCYGAGYPGDASWLRWLDDAGLARERCVFATAPDVVGDAEATLTRSRPFLPTIRDLGYNPALVAQDGIENLAIPWDEFDCLFIGGTTDWKLSQHVRRVTAAARSREKWVHMGRVNSLRRVRYARDIGCDSVDGTFLAFGPERRLPELLGWLDETAEQQGLFRDD